MDEFEVFFTFYGLILGLAAAEILSSLGGLAREGALRAVRSQAALIAFLTFLLICATWIDAWGLRATVTLDLRSLWAPIGASTAYYLAAVVVLPRESSGWGDMDTYFETRKRFIIAALVAAELFATIMYFPSFAEQIRTEPMVFWIFSLPLKIAVFGAFVAMFFAKSRRANIAAIAVQIVIFTIPYWSYRLISNAIREAYDYTVA
jgi:hypothetical protein